MYYRLRTAALEVSHVSCRPFQLDLHRYKEHGDGQNERFRCSASEDCDFQTKYRQTLSTHVREKHEGKKRVQKPPEGDVTYILYHVLCKMVKMIAYRLQFI